jgi:integrase
MSTAFRTARAEPEQLVLFEFGVDLPRLRAACEVIMGASKAANTEAAYRSAWRGFSSWCRAAGRSDLPATADTCMLWAADLIDKGRRLATVRVNLSGVAARHVAEGLQSPFDERCRTFLSNSARLKREKRRFKCAITVEQLRSMLALPGEGQVHARNRAVLAMGFALGWRRSEIASLDLSDVRLEKRGVVVTLGASKSDQTGKGRVVSIPRTGNPTCPVAALEAWLRVRGAFRGPLFVQMRHGYITQNRLGSATICTIIQYWIAAIGEDPSAYGAHSLRAGMITAAAEAGASEISIMQRSGHRSVATVTGYVRPADGFRRDALAGVL